MEASVSAPGEETNEQAGRRIAHERGRGDGAALRRADGRPWRRRSRALAVLTDLLWRQAYEPYQLDDGPLALSNCPFRGVAKSAPEVVCSVNQAYLGGVLATLSDPPLAAVLACREPGDDCCVLIGEVDR